MKIKHTLVRYKEVYDNSKVGILVMIMLCLSACNPDYFYLNRNIEQMAICYNITKEYGKVHRSGNIMNSATIEQGGKLAIKYLWDTQISTGFEIKYTGGEGVCFYLRAFPNDYDKVANVKIKLTEESATIESPELGSRRVDSVRLTRDVTQKVRIINDGAYYTFLLDCDTLINARTKLNCTEYTIVEPLQNTKIELFGIDFECNLPWDNLIKERN